jgi:PPOX class probable F420-dependent enzyme
VLSTVHATRGVDAVPVVFVVHGGQVIVPVDTVKPKSGRRLQRLVNLDADPRCVLLVDHYDDDWAQLWWVRVHGRAAAAAPTEDQLAPLAAAFPPYRAPGSVSAVLVLTPGTTTGWAAEARRR